MHLATSYCNQVSEGGIYRLLWSSLPSSLNARQEDVYPFDSVCLILCALNNGERCGMPGLPGRPTILTEGRVDQVYQATCPSSNWLMVLQPHHLKKANVGLTRMLGLPGSLTSRLRDWQVMFTGSLTRLLPLWAMHIRFSSRAALCNAK